MTFLSLGRGYISSLSLSASCPPFFRFLSLYRLLRLLIFCMVILFLTSKLAFSIIGGENVLPRQQNRSPYPWISSLQYFFSSFSTEASKSTHHMWTAEREQHHACGASLLTPVHITTAAHCLNALPSGVASEQLSQPPSQRFYAIIGGYDRTRPTGQLRVLRQHILYPSYTLPQIRPGTEFVLGGSDLALFELYEPIEHAVLPIASQQQFEAAEAAQMFGWGKEQQEKDSPSSQILKTGHLSLIKNPEQFFTSQGVPVHLDPNDLIEYGLASSSDLSRAAFGDSGSPVVIRVSEGGAEPKFAQIGIVSSGDDSLATLSFAQLPRLLAWLRENLGRQTRYDLRAFAVTAEQRSVATILDDWRKGGEPKAAQAIGGIYLNSLSGIRQTLDSLSLATAAQEQDLSEGFGAHFRTFLLNQLHMDHVAEEAHRPEEQASHGYVLEPSPSYDSPLLPSSFPAHLYPEARLPPDSRLKEKASFFSLAESASLLTSFPLPKETSRRQKEPSFFAHVTHLGSQDPLFKSHGFALVGSLKQPFSFGQGGVSFLYQKQKSASLSAHIHTEAYGVGLFLSTRPRPNVSLDSYLYGGKLHFSHDRQLLLSYGEPRDILHAKPHGWNFGAGIHLRYALRTRSPSLWSLTPVAGIYFHHQHMPPYSETSSSPLTPIAVEEDKNIFNLHVHNTAYNFINSLVGIEMGRSISLSSGFFLIPRARIHWSQSWSLSSSSLNAHFLQNPGAFLTLSRPRNLYEGLDLYFSIDMHKNRKWNLRTFYGCNHCVNRRQSHILSFTATFQF